MKIKEEEIITLISQIDDLLKDIEEHESENQKSLGKVSASYRKSARNLIHYRALREHDLRNLQKKLKNLGLSRFANANSHVKASLLNNSFILKSLIGKQPKHQKKPGLSIKNGKKMQNRFAKELLGFRSKGRRVRIMVTQPSETAEDYSLVYEMVKNGMNCARINCAHDNPEAWLKIIKNVKKAGKELGKKVTITMDLAGPKIRTGEIKAGPKVKKFSPERDDVGHVISPAYIRLTPDSDPLEALEPDAIPLPKEWLKKLKNNDKLKLRDTRGKDRNLRVFRATEEEIIAYCNDSAYIKTGTLIEATNIGTAEVGELPPVEQSIILKTGDTLIINKEGIGEPAKFDEDGKVLSHAHISCQIPEVFDHIKKGDPILFDDGKIEGSIVGVHPHEFEVKIKRAKELGTKLKAEKGINFPTSSLEISGLTKKDKEDLRFVVAHADAVNFSFVNSKADVEELLEELQRLNALEKINVILKIETQRAFDNLIEILLTAMKMKYVGVMIARGDLAVETGWNNIGWVQKEIIGICNAAHIPAIWATQVLENLAKKGLPSRAEITDATTSLKADCVMLNKGPYINFAISLMNSILTDMEKFDEKNESMLPSLGKLGKK